MSGAFRFLTAGESHGEGLTAIIEGLPAGLPLTEADIDADLARRQRGYGRGGRHLDGDHYAFIDGHVKFRNQSDFKVNNKVLTWQDIGDTWKGWTFDIACQNPERTVRVLNMNMCAGSPGRPAP